MSTQSFDYIVVGAGSAGCVLANRLTASGKHAVLLIEAGGADSNFWIPIPLGMPRLLGDPALAWLYRTVATESLASRSLVLTQGKMLGGSSSLNGMIYVRGQKDDYDGWAAGGCPGWAWEDVLPCYKRIESIEGGSDAYHGRSGELRLSWIRQIHPTSESFMQAAQQAGIRFNHDTNSGDQEGIGYIQGTIHRGRRQSTSNTFLAAARSRSNLTVMTGALVRRVLFEDRRAVGIELAGATVRARREVILSAGAVGSPQILQHSGVGEAAHLRSLGIDVVMDLPQVGRNLQDHLFGHLKYGIAKPTGSMNRKFNNIPVMGIELLRWALFGTGALNTTSAQILGFIKSGADQPKPDIQLAMRPFSFHIAPSGEVAVDASPGITVSAINVQPFSRGEVRITSADPNTRASVRPNYLSDHRDVETLTNGIAKLREIMRQSSIAPLVTEELEPGLAATSPQDIEAYLRRAGSTVYHPVGTCRMGSDDDAVLDPRLRVRGIDGLRVIDASVMPRIISGNTNAPSIMIGEKGAELVLADAP
ncbi:MAG: GMC family oxidoreductase N-terminal domain-containing protein [Deltaproteobacteria bacterium]|nr:GMC family oxidoreductase N-terminal domain-containing protein [Deltaproteobacteria bacterium]